MPSDWTDYGKLSALTARLRSVGSETADQAAEAVGALWRHIEEQDQLRAALPTEKALSDMQFAMEEYREITDRLQQCVQRHRLGLGGERIDVLVCDEVDRLRAAHQERDADARRCKQCKVEIDALCVDCRAELRCEACSEVIEDNDFVSTLDGVYLHMRCAGDDA